MRALVLVALWMLAADAAALDPRYCGQPARDASNRIIRSYAERAAFNREVPCPSSGSRDIRNGCQGWAIDHVWPLASCGCDRQANMQWLPLTIKSCAGTECKDRWERRVYSCRPEDAVQP